MSKINDGNIKFHLITLKCFASSPYINSNLCAVCFFKKTTKQFKENTYTIYLRKQHLVRCLKKIYFIYFFWQILAAYFSALLSIKKTVPTTSYLQAQISFVCLWKETKIEIVYIFVYWKNKNKKSKTTIAPRQHHDKMTNNLAK